MFNPKHSINKQDPNLARAGAYDDLNRIKQIKNRMWGLSSLLFILGLFFLYPAHIMIFGGVPFEQRLTYATSFFTELVRGALPGSSYSLLDWLADHHGWYFRAVFDGFTSQAPGIGISLWKSTIVIGGWLTGSYVPVAMIKALTSGLETTPNIYGDTRWADERDIAAMSSRDLVGFDGNLFLVGKLKNQLIRMKETLSVLLLAPPGTGKTVAFIVPSAVTMDRSCQLLNDQKPELFHMTSGHRATLGPVYQLMWSAQDMPNGGWMTEEQASLISPDLIELDHNGEPIKDDSGAIKIRPVHYPSWNPIGPSSIPSPGPKRDLYIERLVNVLCPDPQGGGDKFWTSKARAALVGFIHYLVAKAELGQDDRFPEIDESGLPLYWRGKEPCFPMLVDWFTEAQNAVDDTESDDPMRDMLRAAVNDARRMDEAYSKKFGSPIMNRAIVELTALVNIPDKTRGSILSSMDEALNPFKNEAVRQRTSTSSFSFNELRGSPKPKARAREADKQKKARAEGREYHPRYRPDEWDPITIYISINAEDAKAFATITGIFVDSANAYLVANGPNAIDDRGNQLGPHDFFFLLDETPTLPKLDTVVNGPAVGRSKRVSYAIVGQDFAQIETRYSKPEVETLKSTTAIKVILSQNNETAAKSISAMAGSMTWKKANYQVRDSGDPISKFLDIKKEVTSSDHWEKRDFIDASFVMSMPLGKHIVLVQNFMNRPILADTPRFFEEPEIGRRVYNLRTGKGPKPALPMPARLMQDSASEARESEARKGAAISVQEALSEPEVALIVTPQNISDLSRDLSHGADARINTQPPGNEFGLARAKLDPSVGTFKVPSEDEIEVFSDIASLHSTVSGRRVTVFSREDFDSLNALFRDNNLEEIPDELMVEIRPDLLDIEEEEEGDFFTLGHYGVARNDRAPGVAVISPVFAMQWFSELVAVVQACKFELERLAVSA